MLIGNIIQGLEIIRRHNLKEDGYLELDQGGTLETSTETKVLTEAINRIKDQFPRILTPGEINIGRLVFIEMNSLSPDYGYCERIPPKGNGACSYWFKGCGCVAAIPIETYGVNWWAWTAKPSPEDKEKRGRNNGKL